MESKLRPKVVLWWGIGLTLAGVLSTLPIPPLGWAIVVQPDSASGVDQALLTLLAVILRIAGEIMSPLGVVLIGASVVMAYVRRMLSARTSPADREAADQ